VEVARRYWDIIRITGFLFGFRAYGVGLGLIAMCEREDPGA
jgi:hypothetical protein